MVIAIFAAFTLASIVSFFRYDKILTFSNIFFWEMSFSLSIFLRHYLQGLNLVLSNRLLFHGIPTFRFRFLILLPFAILSVLFCTIHLLHWLFLLFFQGYFSNISEYLRVGPPLYFVVKDYNYRLINFIFLGAMVSMFIDVIVFQCCIIYNLKGYLKHANLRWVKNETEWQYAHHYFPLMCKKGKNSYRPYK